MTDYLATVVIPNYNGRRFLPRLMESLHAQTERRFHIFVVDDCSTDDSAEYLRAAWPTVRVLRLRKNLGFTGACDVGIAGVKTPFLVLLNNDTHVDPAWMAEGLAPFGDAAVGSVASLTLLAGRPELVDTAGDVYSVAGGAVKRCHLRPRTEADALPPEIFSASGVSAFYRTSAIHDAGALDWEFESYYEDVDLGFRLARLGFRCVFAPKSICFHHLSASYNPRGRRYHFNSARNAEIVWWANLPARLIFRYLPAHLAFLALQLAHKTIQGSGGPYVSGKLAALGKLGHIRMKRRFLATLPKCDARELERRLVRDWWGLHVRSRRKAGGGS